MRAAASGLDAATAAAAPAAGAGGRGVRGHSAWESPVPYLFGGIAAMLGLIALALLILACSYWKLSGFLEGGADEEEEAAARVGDAELHLKPVAAARCGYEQKTVVIMAGDEKPTFLATPVSSFGHDRGGRNGDGGKEERREASLSFSSSSSASTLRP